MVVRTALTIFFSLCLVTPGILAQPLKETSQSSPSPQEADSTKSQQPGKSLSLSPEELKAQKELKALKSRPKEYRVLVLGVQIFLGRFGYGIGPYTGVVDENMKKALRTYQQYVGLPETGEIDFLTLKHLTEDNQTLDQPLPFLPKVAFHFEQWDKAIQVQGTWTRDSGLTDDAIQTSRISCFKEEKNCIESTAVLLNGNVPVLEVLTHVYTIKEWDEEQARQYPIRWRTLYDQHSTNESEATDHHAIRGLSAEVRGNVCESENRRCSIPSRQRASSLSPPQTTKGRRHQTHFAGFRVKEIIDAY